MAGAIGGGLYEQIVRLALYWFKRTETPALPKNLIVKVTKTGVFYGPHIPTTVAR